MSESLFIRMFAGVPLDYSDTVPLIPFGQWLLTAGIFLLAAGLYTERDKKAEMLSMYRYKTIPGWWKRHFQKGIVSGIKAAGALLLAALACDAVMGNTAALSAGLCAEISILWLCHSVSMASLSVLLDLSAVRHIAPGVLFLFLLEGMTFIIGWRVRAVSHVMYGMWGMYLQSSLCGTEGFPAGRILAAEMILPAAVFFIGREYVKKETDVI